MDTLDRASVRIRVRDHLSREVHLERGVRQGDPLSGLLFAIAINPLIRGLRNTLIVHGDRAKIFDAPAYADDIDVTCSSAAVAQHLLDHISGFCTATNMAINVSKTKCARNEAAARREPLVMLSYQSQLVEIQPPNTPSKILGVLFRMDGRWTDQKAAAKRRLFHALSLIKSRAFTPFQLARIINTTVMATLAYPMVVVEYEGKELDELQDAINRLICGKARIFGRAIGKWFTTPVEQGGLGLNSVRDMYAAQSMLAMQTIINGSSTPALNLLRMADREENLALTSLDLPQGSPWGKYSSAAQLLGVSIHPKQPKTRIAALPPKANAILKTHGVNPRDPGQIASAILNGRYVADQDELIERLDLSDKEAGDLHGLATTARHECTRQSVRAGRARPQYLVGLKPVRRPPTLHTMDGDLGLYIIATAYKHDVAYPLASYALTRHGSRQQARRQERGQFDSQVAALLPDGDTERRAALAAAVVALEDAKASGYRDTVVWCPKQLKDAVRGWDAKKTAEKNKTNDRDLLRSIEQYLGLASGAGKRIFLTDEEELEQHDQLPLDGTVHGLTQDTRDLLLKTGRSREAETKKKAQEALAQKWVRPEVQKDAHEYLDEYYLLDQNGAILQDRPHKTAKKIGLRKRTGNCPQSRPP